MYSDSSRDRSRSKKKSHQYQESSDDYSDRRPRRIYENRRVAPKQRGDRIRTQLDDLGEIERVFNYDTDESSDGGKYGNIKIINMPYDGRKHRGKDKGYDNRYYRDDDDEFLEANEDVPLVEVSKPVEPNKKMLAHKPPPKKVEFSNKLNELNKFINPYGFFWTVWTFLIIMLCVYELLMVPFVVAFKFLGNGGLWTFDYIVDFFFLLDIGFLFFVARAPKTYYLITDKTRVQLYYAWGWFMVDFIASFPMDIFVWIAFGVRDRNYTRFLKVFHFFRLYRAIHQLVKKGREKENLTSEKWILLNPNIERFADILIFFYLIIHYGACLWITYGNVAGFGSSAFLPPLSLSGAGFGSQYLNALHWSFYSIIGPFSLLHKPISIGETFFSVLLGIFGMVFYVGMTALLANLLRTVDEHNSQWQKNQMDINLAHKRKMAQEWLLIQLASEPLFEGVGLDVLNALAARCKFKSFPPHVSIVRETALPGPYLYFLKRGIIQESKEGKHIAYLGAGSSFNQRGFLVPKTPADHTLHTVKYSELFVLRKSDLIRVAQFYPAFNEHLVSKMNN